MHVPPALSYLQPLNTLHIDLGSDWRGGQNQALLLANGLRDLGHTAILIAPERSPLAARACAEGVPVHGVGENALRLRAAHRIARLITTHSIDVVHCHEAHALTAAWLAGAHRRVVLIASRRVTFPVSRNRIALARYKAADRILAVSQFVRRRTIEGGLSSEQVEVVYDGVPLGHTPTAQERHEARQSWGVGREPLIGCVGYLVPEKGQEYLIRALPLVRDRFPNCVLLLAGDGPCRPRLQRLSVDLGVASAVRFAGFIPDVARVYRALDAFAFPSISEALGSSLLTAMAYGLPAVGLAAGAIPEIIEHEANGLLAQTTEPQDVAARLMFALRDRAPTSYLGVAARRTIEERFMVGRMVQGTMAAYEEARAVRRSAS